MSLPDFKVTATFPHKQTGTHFTFSFLVPHTEIYGTGVGPVINLHHAINTRLEGVFGEEQYAEIIARDTPKFLLRPFH